MSQTAATNHRKRYETPRIHSSSGFERLALACTGVNNSGRNTVNCTTNPQGTKTGNGCVNCSSS